MEIRGLITLIGFIITAVGIYFATKEQFQHRRKYKDKIGKYFIEETGFFFTVLLIGEYHMIKIRNYSTLEEAQAFIEKANKEPIIHGLK
jgi:hypothetical protein